MNMDGLVDYLIDIGPHDQPFPPDIEDDTPPPPAEEDTEDDEFVRENKLMEREDELAEESIQEGNPREEPSVEYEPKEDLGEDLEEEPLEEDDPRRPQ